jgi:hypothetical protein
MISKVNSRNLYKKTFLLLGAIVTWFAVIGQYAIILSNSDKAILEETVVFFSYFTILTNTLVAIFFSILLLPITGRIRSFFESFSVQTALAVYIVVVGVLYSLLLRGTWEPKGFQIVIDELLHTIVPFLYVLYWVLFTTKQAVSYKQIWGWLIYPAVYLFYVIIRGVITGVYPYPFINVDKIGAVGVTINGIGMAVVFVVLSLLFITLLRYPLSNKA